MQRLQGGRDAALNDLMDRHAAKVFHFLCRMTGNEDDASDLAQETFVRVFKSVNSYRTEQKFTTWLYTIAANLARNHHRWRSRHATVSLEAEGPDDGPSLGERLPAPAPPPAEEMQQTERHHAVRQAVASLPDELREAVVLCEWDELAVAEAAAVLKTTPKTVESRLYRARRELRKRLAHWLAHE